MRRPFLSLILCMPMRIPHCSIPTRPRSRNATESKCLFRYLPFQQTLNRPTNSVEWKGVIPGVSSANNWDAMVGVNTLPSIRNPSSGFIQSCGTSPLINFQNESGSFQFPHNFGFESQVTNQALRVNEIFRSLDNIDWETFKAIKFDEKYSDSSLMVLYLNKFIEHCQIAEGNDDQWFVELENHSRALEVLILWDHTLSADNPYATLPYLTFSPFISTRSDFHLHFLPAATFEFLAPVFEQRFSIVVQQLTMFYSSLEVPWSKVQRIIVNHDSGNKTITPIGGGIDVLHHGIFPFFPFLLLDLLMFPFVTVYSVPDGNKLKIIGGDGPAILANWNNGKVHVEAIHPLGSTPANMHSAHSHDQVELYSKKQYVPVCFDLDTLRKGCLETEYTPGRERSPEKEEK